LLLLLLLLERFDQSMLALPTWQALCPPAHNLPNITLPGGWHNHSFESIKRLLHC